MLVQTLKRLVVRMIGRDRANHLSAPYHDWRAAQRTHKLLRGLPASGLLVNLGCGTRPLPGWVNLDRARGPAVDVVWDLARGLPFPAGSCSAIFAEHVIEHVSRADAELLLRECYRALAPHGVIRLSTPDAARYLRSYAGDGEFLHHPMFQRPIETPLDRINVMMRQDGQHLWVYDAESLLRLVKKAGFQDATEQQYACSDHPQMRNIDEPDRAFESLYVEGKKGP